MDPPIIFPWCDSRVQSFHALNTFKKESANVKKKQKTAVLGTEQWRRAVMSRENWDFNRSYNVQLLTCSLKSSRCGSKQVSSQGHVVPQ